MMPEYLHLYPPNSNQCVTKLTKACPKLAETLFKVNVKIT